MLPLGYGAPHIVMQITYQCKSPINNAAAERARKLSERPKGLKNLNSQCLNGLPRALNVFTHVHTHQPEGLEAVSQLQICVQNKIRSHSLLSFSGIEQTLNKILRNHKL